MAALHLNPTTRLPFGLFPGIPLVILPLIKASTDPSNKRKVHIWRNSDKVLPFASAKPVLAPHGEGKEHPKLTVCCPPNSSRAFINCLCTLATGCSPIVISALRSNQSPFKSNSTSLPSLAFLKKTLLFELPKLKWPLTSKSNPLGLSAVKLLFKARSLVLMVKSSFVSSGVVKVLVACIEKALPWHFTTGVWVSAVVIVKVSPLRESIFSRMCRVTCAGQ